MCLPKEIRVLIYRQTLDEFNYPHVKWSGDIYHENLTYEDNPASRNAGRQSSSLANRALLVCIEPGLCWGS